jgi:hypothetical protein
MYIKIFLPLAKNTPHLLLENGKNLPASGPITLEAMPID